jgi:hypothetical protein
MNPIAEKKENCSKALHSHKYLMFRKDLVSKMYPSFILLLSFLLLCMVYNVVPASAQQDTSNFLTYSNTDLGFTINYPSDWTIVEDTKVVSDNSVRFDSADRVAHVLVNIQPATPEQISICTLNNESEKGNVFRSMLLPGEKVLELDFTRYFLSGLLAVRVIEIQSFGEPGGLPAPSSSTPQDYDLKAMVYNILLDGNWYKVAYGVTA